MEYKDYYKILGVEKTASKSEMQKAYRKLAKKYHPDVSKEKDAERRYKEINEAYEVLKDPEKREKYDTLGANWQQGQDFAPPPGWGRENIDLGGDFGNFSDFFKTIFGSRFSGGGGFGGDYQHRRSPQRNSEVELEISLEDAARGGTHTFLLTTRGASEPTKINVKLPRGVSDKSRIRLSGKAPSGGDLYATLRIAPHPVFEVDGYNLSRSVKIAPHTAVLGGTVSVDTLDGNKIDMKLPPLIQNGQKLRLKGKGLPKRAEGENGDMLVKVEIAIPKSLTAQQKKLWEQLAELS
ncbi:molecular chaperone DnaJ [Synergistales bacterium]|nr:molecular chaperone DnaJ [Synergistales bacterium]